MRKVSVQVVEHRLHADEAAVHCGSRGGEFAGTHIFVCICAGSSFRLRFGFVTARSAVQVQANDEVLGAVMEASDGDMRKAVTYLQSAHQLARRGDITPQLITDISGKVNSLHTNLRTNQLVTIKAHALI